MQCLYMKCCKHQKKYILLGLRSKIEQVMSFLLKTEQEFSQLFLNKLFSALKYSPPGLHKM